MNRKARWCRECGDPIEHGTTRCPHCRVNLGPLRVPPEWSAAQKERLARPCPWCGELVLKTDAICDACMGDFEPIEERPKGPSPWVVAAIALGVLAAAVLAGALAT